jgi:hypothetical protein
VRPHRSPEAHIAPGRIIAALKRAAWTEADIEHARDTAELCRILGGDEAHTAVLMRKLTPESVAAMERFDRKLVRQLHRDLRAHAADDPISPTPRPRRKPVMSRAGRSHRAHPWAYNPSSGRLRSGSGGTLRRRRMPAWYAEGTGFTAADP